MLNLILGRQLSGKSYYLLKTAESISLSGGNVVMIVPEQYTFEMQKKLLKELGPEVSNRINILSFTGLCEDIGNCYGGISGITVDDGIRFILVKNALKSVSDSLKHYRRYVNSPEFAKQMLTVIGEMKTAAVSPEALAELSVSLEPSLFADKLHDISLILKCYDSLLLSKFADPFDLTKKTVEKLPDNSYFSGKVFLIDEFKGFTETQYLLLDRIISASDDVYVSFCCDSTSLSGATEVFSNIKKNVARLKELAVSRGEKVKEITVSETGRYKTTALSRFEEYLAEKSLDKFSDSASEITVVNAESTSKEIDYVMRTVKRLVREKGYRYNDFLIISRNADAYTDIIEITAEKYGVPCYVDNKISAITLPLSVFAVSALKAAESFDTADILKMLKTGLTDIAELDVSLIENYAYVWNITGSRWKDEWNDHPDGLVNEKRKRNVDNEQLNTSRKRIVSALFKLRNSFGSTAEAVCRGLLGFFDELGTVDALKLKTSLLERAGRLTEAEYQRSGFDVFIKTLDKIVAVSGDDTVLPTEFVNMLTAALGFETVGEIPQTMDQVIYGTADRIRAVSPKAVFAIGVNDGLFPASASDGGIFSSVEREVLRKSGCGVSDASIEEAVDEKFLFYYACTCASERVYISYPSIGADGRELFPSPVITELGEMFPKCRFLKGTESALLLENIETEENAFELLSDNFDETSALSVELKSFFEGDAKYRDKLKSIQNFSCGGSRRLNDKTVDMLYGDDIVLSATKIETFSNCRFMHFCRYGLGIEPLNKVDFDAMTRGNILHYVLDKFISSHMDDIGKLREDLIKDETAELCNRYIIELGVDRSRLGKKFVYMLELLKDTAYYIVCAVNNEFGQSTYRPSACELKIGDIGGEGIASVKVPTDGGRNVKISGSIDRVDTTPNGKVRVIDYKSGKKEFELTDLLNGVKMQMLLYLYSIVKNGKELLSAEHPTAVLYFPARRDALSADKSHIRMNGRITSDIDSIHEMEASGEGEILPVKFYPNGTKFYENKSTVDDEVFSIAFKYVELSLRRIGSMLEKGDISAVPLADNKMSACEWCDYRLICRPTDDFEKREKLSLRKNDAITAMTAETEEN